MIENKQQRSKDASLWYTTKDSWPDRIGSAETNGLCSVANKWVDPVKYMGGLRIVALEAVINSCKLPDILAYPSMHPKEVL